MKKRVFTPLLMVLVFAGSLSAQIKVDDIVFSMVNSSGSRNSSGSVNSPGSENSITVPGRFISLKDMEGYEWRAFVAGPEDSNSGILLVHDFFGITPATKEAVERLGALGYRTAAVDLYNGKSASRNDSAEALMKAKDRKETDRILKDGIAYLKRPGRKLVTIGFSAGGADAMNANLMDPESFNGTIIVYGGGYDQIEKSRLDKLKSPVFAITGSKDEWPVQAALNFMANEKDKSLELYIYPDAYHAYAQPLFSDGKNYNAEATRITWKLMEDFLSRHLDK
jgi:carboxymethylenebutenolidase